MIPVVNEGARLPELLSRLRREFGDAELIVVDGGSRDGSVSLALMNADLVLLGEAGRARQMNLGAACAKNHWLAFLHADTQPRFDTNALRAVLAGDVRWGFCRIALQGRSSGLAMVSAFMNRRSGVTRIATGDQLLIVERELFEVLGGFAAMPLMEDVELCKRLRRHAPGGMLPLVVDSSGRRWDEKGLWRTIFRMWALRLAFFAGVSPHRLWRHYYGKHALKGSPGGQ
ncbi:Glycosyltransferase involved in cell wall biogenesis [Congregibacter litoralis KT71]|uniref:Glycosyltransferase involved in cell wall biogenesis n=1 Tax=Congregibacter litoralis KT71 TaxID=314285 RepID=A4A806_9GAMM|nr:Glycosyltransferase involved in cell wall biogenesis [Congregibacter litoralis KT71]